MTRNVLRSIGRSFFSSFLLVCFLFSSSFSLADVSTTANRFGSGLADLKLSLVKLSLKVRLLEQLSQTQTTDSQRLRELSATLQIELESSKRTISDLSNSLETSQLSASGLRRDLEILSDLAASLQQRLTSLSTQFDDFRTASRRALIRTIVIAVSAGLAAGALAGIILE